MNMLLLLTVEPSEDAPAVEVASAPAELSSAQAPVEHVDEGVDDTGDEDGPEARGQRERERERGSRGSRAEVTAEVEGTPGSNLCHR